MNKPLTKASTDAAREAEASENQEEISQRSEVADASDLGHTLAIVPNDADKAEAADDVSPKVSEATEVSEQKADASSEPVKADETVVSAEGEGEEEPFDAPVRTDVSEASTDDFEALIVNLDGYAGPLDVLLELARSQKVDLRKISMLALVEQYLAFVDAVKARKLEVAADYLVMAAWLAFLKSKLLLPVPKDDGEEPSADEMAAQLAFQLQRLEAMRKASDDIMNMPQLGVDFFVRGAPEGVRVVKKADWQASLFDLLGAYARQRVAAVERTYKPEPPKVLQIEEARERLTRILGRIPEWATLSALANESGADAPASSIMASAFSAALEFAKDGKIDLRQTSHFEPIYIRRKASQNPPTSHSPHNNGEMENHP